MFVCGFPRDGIPAAGFDESGYLVEESRLETWDVGAAACEDDARHAKGADVGGEGEKAFVDEEVEGLVVVVEIVGLEGWSEESCFDRGGEEGDGDLDAVAW